MCFALFMTETGSQENHSYLRVVLLMHDKLGIGFKVKAISSNDVILHRFGDVPILNAEQGFLLVQEVHDIGLVDCWNAHHPDHKVEAGQLIVQVNGEYGSCAKLEQSCQTKQGVLELKLLRPTMVEACNEVVEVKARNDHIGGEDEVEVKTNEKAPLHVIILSGMRASGKSLLGRTLWIMLGCHYQDLDEQRVPGMKKYEHFLKTCEKNMLEKGGVWIIDKLSPYDHSPRQAFIESMWLNAEKVVLLKFTHKDPVKELRICYHRFRRRGENHYDPAANGEEDVYYNLKAEQKQRKDLNLVEEYCLNSLELTMQCKRISLAMNDVPFRAVSQACAALFELGIAERDDVVGAETNLESCIWKALKQSLAVEGNISQRKQKDLDTPLTLPEPLTLEQLNSDGTRICKEPIRFEPGHHDHPFMRIVSQRKSKFLAKLNFIVDDETLLGDILGGACGEASGPVFELCMSFCSSAGIAQVQDPEHINGNSLTNWLEGKTECYPEEAGELFETIASTVMQDHLGKLNDLQLEVLTLIWSGRGPASSGSQHDDFPTGFNLQRR